jgi:hypothetical protein
VGRHDLSTPKQTQAEVMAMTKQTLSEKAKKCLAGAVPIPGAPLWRMGKAALGSRTDYEALQGAIDCLTCKAKARAAFTTDDKEFLVEIFEALWWGGHAKRLPEAAALANHYVNGKGKPLKVDEEVYRSSVIVRDTCVALKAHVRKQLAGRRDIGMVRSSDPGFIYSPGGRQLARGPLRSVQRQGYIRPEGILVAEQGNLRLKNADNRFALVAYTTILDSGELHTRWRVDSRYDFEPFDKADYVTNIPLSDSQVLKLPDGLSQYMTVLKIAEEFPYFAEWIERWNA